MKNNRSVSPRIAEATREEKLRRLKRRESDPDFRSTLASVHKRLNSGQSLWDIRDVMGIKNDRLWADIVFALGMSFASPESILLEWQVRNRSRLQMGIEMWNAAKLSKDIDAMGKAIMILSKMDENTIELQRALGLLKPIVDPNSGGEGYTDEDVQNAGQRFDEYIEAQIIGKKSLERSVEMPVALIDVTRTEPGRPTDSVVPTPLAEDPPK